MEAILIEEITGDELEIKVFTRKYSDKTFNDVIILDANSGDECVNMTRYTSEQARKLAAALILASEETEKI